MQKILALSLALSGSSALAATLPELLGTSTSVIAAACADGYRIQGMPRTGLEQTRAYNLASGEAAKGRTLTDYRSMSEKKDPLASLQGLTQPIKIQTPAGSAYNICSTAATELREQPKPEDLKPLAYVYVNGAAGDRSASERWNAVLIFIDASGAELKRLPATYAQKGDLKNWKPSCTSGGCRWIGHNVYGFKPGEFPNEYDRVRVLFTRGQGTEQRDYTAADFTQTALYDPK